MVKNRFYSHIKRKYFEGEMSFLKSLFKGNEKNLLAFKDLILKHGKKEKHIDKDEGESKPNQKYPIQNIFVIPNNIITNNADIPQKYDNQCEEQNDISKGPDD